MKKQQQKIRVEAFCHVGDKLVNVDDLTQEQKVRLATELKKRYLNELFRGRAVFYEEGEQPPELRAQQQSAQAQD